MGEGGSSQALGMNDHGDIVGWAAPFGGMSSAVLWKHGHRSILASGSEGASAMAVNDAGQAVGSVGEAAVMFTGGQNYVVLGSLGGAAAQANAISANGLVAGTAYTAGNAGQHAFSWAGGTMTDLGAPVGFSSYGQGINSSGTVVGYAYSLETTAFEGLVWIGGAMYDVDDLLDPATGAGWTFSMVSAINDAGQLCAYGNNGSAVLTPM
jgi:probable HAF family extracellular repeat protein